MPFLQTRLEKKKYVRNIIRVDQNIKIIAAKVYFK